MDDPNEEVIIEIDLPLYKYKRLVAEWGDDLESALMYAIELDLLMDELGG